MSICSKLSCDFIKKLFEQKKGGLFEFKEDYEQAIFSFYNETINVNEKEENIDFLEFVIEKDYDNKNLLHIFNQIPLFYQSKEGLNIDNQIHKLNELIPKECYVYDYNYDRNNIDYPANISIVCESKRYPLDPSISYEYQMYDLYPTMKKEAFDNVNKVKKIIETENIFKL